MTGIFDKIAECGLINSAISGMAFSSIYYHQSCQSCILCYFEETSQEINGYIKERLFMASGDLSNKVQVLEFFHVLHVLI